MVKSIRGLCLPLAVATVAFLGCTDQTPAGPDMDLVMQAARGAGGGSGGGGHTPGASNFLSWPTIMLGGSFTNVTCSGPGSLVHPSGGPLSGFEIAPADFYFVQGVNPWQAECLNWQADETKTVYASWGDNLSGDAKLKVNMPIRVELGLETTDFAAMDGFAVVKLEPSELDRNSAYGTFATPDGAGGFYATATSYTSLRVFDPGVTFSVQNVATGDYVVQPGVPPTAEINATGKVVYGYNLRVPDKGDYEITFVVPGVTISAVNRGTFNSVVGGPDTASLTINVVAAGGGGGGGGKGGGKGGGQGG